MRVRALSVCSGRLLRGAAADPGEKVEELALVAGQAPLGGGLWLHVLESNKERDTLITLRS